MWQWAWQWIQEGGAGMAALLTTLLAHQIINCQYTKPATGRAKVQQRQHQQLPGASRHQDVDADANVNVNVDSDSDSDAKDVTAPKAATSATSVKCFYNCQMAMALAASNRSDAANIASATATATATAIATATATATTTASGIKGLSATLAGAWPAGRISDY